MIEMEPKILVGLIIIAISIVISGYIGYEKGKTAEHTRISNIENQWLYKNVEATGDYFMPSNEGTMRFRGKVIAVSVRTYGTFITVYNSTTKTLYPSESIEYFQKI